MLMIEFRQFCKLSDIRCKCPKYTTVLLSPHIIEHKLVIGGINMELKHAIMVGLMGRQADRFHQYQSRRLQCPVL